MIDKIETYIMDQMIEAQRRPETEYMKGIIRGLQIALAACRGQVSIWAAGSDNYYE